MHLLSARDRAKFRKALESQCELRAKEHAAYLALSPEDQQRYDEEQRELEAKAFMRLGGMESPLSPTAL